MSENSLWYSNKHFPDLKCFVHDTKVLLTHRTYSSWISEGNLLIRVSGTQAAGGFLSTCAAVVGCSSDRAMWLIMHWLLKAYTWKCQPPFRLLTNAWIIWLCLMSCTKKGEPPTTVCLWLSVIQLALPCAGRTYPLLSPCQTSQSYTCNHKAKVKNPWVTGGILNIREVMLRCSDIKSQYSS